MHKSTFGAVFFGLLCSATLAQPLAIVNPGFEDKDPKEWTAGWTTLQHAGEIAYRFKADAVDPHRGKLSGQIEQYAPQAFGLFKQRIDVRRYIGKRVKVAAYLKSQDVKAGGGGVYVRIDGASDAILGHDFRSGATQGTHGWKPFRTVVEIPAGARWLEFGVMLQDLGILWADEFEVSETTEAVSAAPLKPIGPTFDFQPVPNETDDRRPKTRRVQP